MSHWNWLTIVLPALLSTFAGAVILADLGLGLGPGEAKLAAGLSALLAGLLTAAHRALKCDEYQAECQRLTQAYRSLDHWCDYARHLDDTRLTNECERILIRLNWLTESVKATLPDRYTTDAETRLQSLSSQLSKHSLNMDRGENAAAS